MKIKNNNGEDAINSKNLLKISCVVSILGILLICLLAVVLEPEQIQISRINEKSLDKFVKIQGYGINPHVIEDENSRYAFTIFKLQDNSGEIEVIFSKPVELKNFQEIQVIGKVSSYQDQLQIEAYKIRIVE